MSWSSKLFQAINKWKWRVFSRPTNLNARNFFLEIDGKIMKNTGDLRDLPLLKLNECIDLHQNTSGICTSNVLILCSYSILLMKVTRCGAGSVEGLKNELRIKQTHSKNPIDLGSVPHSHPRQARQNQVFSTRTHIRPGRRTIFKTRHVLDLYSPMRTLCSYSLKGSYLQWKRQVGHRWGRSTDEDNFMRFVFWYIFHGHRLWF